MQGAFDFTKRVRIIDWVSGCEVGNVTPEMGLLMMFRSSRYDGNHATANVRTLHREDALAIKCLDIQSITFNQD